MGRGKKGGGGAGKKALSGRQNVAPGTKHDAGKRKPGKDAVMAAAAGLPPDMAKMVEMKQEAAEKMIMSKLEQVKQLEEQMNSGMRLFEAGANDAQADNWQAALEKWTEAASKLPHLPNVWYYLGLAKFKLGQLSEAVPDVKKAIEMGHVRQFRTNKYQAGNKSASTHQDSDLPGLCRNQL